MASWFDHFKFSMNSAGCPVPTDLFSTYSTATATIGAMAAAITSFGAKATALEVLMTATGATLAADVALMLGALGGAYYLGCAIGASIYATAETAREYFSGKASKKSASANTPKSPSEILKEIGTPEGLRKAVDQINKNSGTNIEVPTFVAGAIAEKMPRLVAMKGLERRGAAGAFS